MDAWWSIRLPPSGSLDLTLWASSGSTPVLWLCNPWNGLQCWIHLKTIITTTIPPCLLLGRFPRRYSSPLPGIPFPHLQALYHCMPAPNRWDSSPIYKFSNFHKPLGSLELLPAIQLSSFPPSTRLLKTNSQLREQQKPINLSFRPRQNNTLFLNNPPPPPTRVTLASDQDVSFVGKQPASYTSATRIACHPVHACCIQKILSVLAFSFKSQSHWLCSWMGTW